MTFGALLLALHLLGAILWVGGLFFALAVLRPAMAVLDAPQRLALHAQVFARFFRALMHVVPVLLLTGIAMDYLFYGSVLAAPWPVQLMALAGLAMTTLFGLILAGPWPAMRRAIAAEDAARAGAAVRRIRTLVLASLVLGLLTAVVAALDY